MSTKQIAVKRKNGEPVRLGIFFGQDVHVKAKELAEEERRSISNLCSVLVEREYDRKHPEQKDAA